MEDLLGWLPAGWIVEIKTRKGGASAGNQYKCYIAPRTGCKFYSKKEVFRYLETGKTDHEAPQPKKRKLNMLSADNIVSRIEKSPAGLPPGWTKEIKFRKKIMGLGFRKDPYYTDPVTGYIFRSKRDAIHYLESGNIGMHVIRPKKMCISAKDSTNNKNSSPVTAKRQKLTSNSARRCLFEAHSLNINGAKVEQISGSTLEEQRAEDVDSSSLGCTRKQSKTRKGKRVQVKKRHPVVEDKHSESRDKKLVGNGVKFDPEDMDQALETDNQQKPNVALSELEVKHESGVLLETERKLSLNGVPLESADSNQTGSKVLLGKQNEKPSNNRVLMESEETKLQIENQTWQTHKFLVQNMGPSELENKKQKNGAFLESRNRKLSANGVPPKSGDNNQTENQPLAELQNWKQSENWVGSEDTNPLENGSQLESKVKTLLEEKSESGKAQLGSRKTKAEKATFLPRRASKRLAGLEAEAVALDITCPKRFHGVAIKHLAADHALESTPSSLADQVSEQLDHLISNLQPDLGHTVGSTLSSCADQVSSNFDDFNFSLQADSTSCTPQETKGTEQQPEEPLVEPQVDQKPESPPILPFGDSWLDPCFEFAFKTLTGDIPAAMDTTAIEDYFQQQLGVGQSQNLSSNGELQSEVLFEPGEDMVGPIQGGKPEEKGKSH